MTTETAPQEFTREAATAEHEWLKRFIGKWDVEGDGAAPETVEALGDLWIVGRGTGAGTQTQLTLGFDPARGHFVGSWVGSMMTYHWVYKGHLERNTLVLDCEGPAFDGSGAMQPYRDVHEFIDNDHRVLKAYVQETYGTWTHFMTTNYTRK